MTSTLRDPEYRAFVERLASLRRAAGVSQSALAHKLGKPQSYVSKVERFERRIDVAEFRALVIALGGDASAEFRTVDQALG